MKKNKLALIPITLICIAPYLWLIIDIITKKYEKLLIEAVMIFPSIVILTLSWRYYCVSDVDDEEDYEWE